MHDGILYNHLLFHRKLKFKKVILNGFYKKNIIWIKNQKLNSPFSKSNPIISYLSILILQPKLPKNESKTGSRQMILVSRCSLNSYQKQCKIVFTYASRIWDKAVKWKFKFRESNYKTSQLAISFSKLAFFVEV